MPRTVVSDCTEQCTPNVKVQSSTQPGISDTTSSRGRPYGLPTGLWRSECSALSWGETETPFMFFRNKASLSEMLTALPALLLTLPSGGGIQNSVSVPAVECEDEDRSQQGESDFEITDVANAASAMPIQHISFPLYSEDDEIEDILIERAYNSFRISFRFVAPHVELKSTLHAFLSGLQHSLSSTFTFTPLDKENPLKLHQMHKPPVMTHRASLQCHAGGSLSALSYKMCWANLFETEDPSRTLESFMAVSLLRKHPLKTFDLSLLVTPVHIAYFSVEGIRAHINSILKNLQTSVLQSAKLLYRNSSSVGSVYMDIFDLEMKRMYGDTEQNAMQ
eukprot:Protomagalhaensia_sp_Gyna_25__5757@NODE_834_length_2537_cov_470_258607_g658_i0_p1_GENE_NODE_834_length_2537_cov_470_258607_g658_i0NODE_834_length_2537_cov_470_258607_g658_i0_p1_ORF_typecomplete_len335_score43_78ARPC4/PF05856_12/0_029ARPC4/PF05856_12/0_013_NODE_834_length_2537_cov_470_258607_g658_i08791883